MSAEQEGFGPVVAAAFTVNYVFGAGVLAIPHAFATAGIVASLLFLVLVTVISIATMWWTVEACGRGEEILDLRKRQEAGRGLEHGEKAGRARKRSGDSIDGDQPAGAATSELEGSETYAHKRTREIRDALQTISGTSESPGTETDTVIIPVSTPTTSAEKLLKQPLLAAEDDVAREVFFSIEKDPLEVSELCEIFVGSQLRKFFEVSVFLYGLSSCWAYGVIFTLSVSNALDVPFLNLGNTRNNSICDFNEVQSRGFVGLGSECVDAYHAWATLFSVLMLCMSSMDYSGQVGFQIGLSCFGISCVIVMATTTAIAMAHGPYVADAIGNVSSVAAASGSHISPTAQIFFSFDGFGTAFATFVFAQLAHHGVPGLTSLVADKKNTPLALAMGLTVTGTSYAVLGICLALYFGEDAYTVVSLNWKTYTESEFISYLIMLFPATTVATAFPLNIVTLADTFKSGAPKWVFCGMSDEVSIIVTRLVLCAIPLTGTFLYPGISLIVSVCGLIGFNIAFIVPSILQIYSKRMCRTTFGICKSPYGGWWSKDMFPKAVLAFAAVGLPFAVIELVRSLLKRG